MNPVDRFQALIRHPDYCKDSRLHTPTLKIGLLHFVFEVATGHVSARRWHEVVKAYTFLRTWGLSRPVDLDDLDQVAAVLKRLNAGDDEIFLADLRTHDADKHEETIDPVRGCLIRLYVDIWEPMPELKKLFATKVREKRRELRVTPNRTRPIRANPWEVWDLKACGHSYRKISRIIFKVRGNLTYQKAKNAYERVLLAHKKAIAMIDEVGKTRNKAITTDAVKVSLTQSIRTIIQRL